MELKTNMENQQLGTKTTTSDIRKFLWFLFAFAIVIYNIVAIAIAQYDKSFKGYITSDEFITFPLLLIFVNALVINFIVLFNLRVKLKKAQSDKEKQKYSILSFIVSEVIAIYGLVLFLIGGGFNQLYFFSVMALIAMFLVYPGEFMILNSVKQFIKSDWKNGAVIGFVFGLIVSLYSASLNGFKESEGLITPVPTILFFTLVGAAAVYTTQSTVYWKKTASMCFAVTSIFFIFSTFFIFITSRGRLDHNSAPLVGVIIALLFVAIPVVTIFSAIVSYVADRYKNNA